eukprot:3338349-Pleurochrysis_carterae.AAC.1
MSLDWLGQNFEWVKLDHMCVIEEHEGRVQRVSTGGHPPSLLTYLVSEPNNSTTEQRGGTGILGIIDDESKSKPLFADEEPSPWEFLIWPGPRAPLTFLRDQNSQNCLLPLSRGFAEILGVTNPSFTWARLAHVLELFQMKGMPKSGTPEIRQLERTRHLPRCEARAQRSTSRAR